MKDFTPNKGKAVMRAIATEANQKAEKAVELLADKWVEGAVVLGVLQASFGLRLAYKQELLNQFTEYMMKHPEVFTEEVLASPEFHDGLIVALGTYFRLRTDEKRKMVEEIFYDFGKSAEKPLYPLERYDDTVEKISQSGIRLLGFIHTEVPKIQEEYVKEKMRENGNATDEASVIFMHTEYTRGKALSFWIECHIKKMAKQKVSRREDGTWLSDLSNVENEMREEMSLSISELEQLSIASRFQRQGGWGGGESGYSLTHYGKMFISVVKPSNSAVSD